MQNVVVMKAAEPARRRIRPAGHTAEIVIFPGVRYERHAEPARAAAGSRRDHLDIAD